MADAFENILGQPKVREFLRASVVSERVTQAYLFVGPAGSNKTQAAYALAQALMCPKGPRGPRGGSCGACDRCGRILRRKHPDVRYFAPAGANGYLVEQVREIVADKKIYILDRVDQLGASAANAFLKTLEEPADDVVMILLGRTRESVLPTIVSRCQVVPFRHIPASEAAGIDVQFKAELLRQRNVYHQLNQEAHTAIEACGGSITSAVAFLRAPGSERLAFRTRLFSDLAMLQRADDWDVVEMARALVEASLSRAEFVMRERNFGYPDGVVLAMSAMAGWLYADDDPAAYLRFEDVFASLREKVEEGYFETLLRELFLDNDHRACAEVVPTESDEAADAMLAAFGLAACAERHPLALSGGERQRLAVAAGLAQGARVLVLDEPTSGLDRANMERVAAVLRRAAADGVAVVLVTHDYEFLCAVCDEAAEVEGGRIQARYPLDDAGLARVRARFGL